MTTKLTVLVDNIANENLKGEWGLSILAEYKGKKILVDAGASKLFANNMEQLGFDIKDIDYATLSHAHYDHANGMTKFLSDNDKAKLYVQETIQDNCYARKFIFSKYIGIPHNLLSDYSERLVKVSGDYEMMEGAYIIPHKTSGLEAMGRRESMFRKQEHKWIPDDFNHEQSLVLDTDKGLVIINCCSHGGAANIVREVEATFPDKKIYALIGGFHLFNKRELEVQDLAYRLKECGVEQVVTGHCTGDKAFKIMKEILGDSLQQLRCGLTLEY